MNNIDKLIEKIFDENETNLQGMDPLMAKEAESLRQLKSDLKLLREVPECQLTADHLRRAILQTKPVRPSPWKSIFMWSPFAAAASVAFAVVMLKSQNPSLQPILGSDKAVPVSRESSDDGAIASVVTPKATLKNEVLQSAPSTKPDSAKTVKTRRESRETVIARSESPSVSKLAMASTEGALTEPKRDAAPAGMGGGGSFDSEAKTELSDPGKSEPVVIVTESPDMSTGAAEATEVSKPTDVVFGG